ncbi:MAG: hypothetical protein ACI9R3_005009 [Verrucomicrobiales bacterium]
MIARHCFSWNTTLARFLYLKNADVDSDGNIDIIVSSRARCSWFENLGEGAYGPSRLIGELFSTPLTESVAVAAGDFDGDGDSDIAASQDRLGSIVWFENTDGTGSFGERHLLPELGLDTHTLQAIDVDQDGDDDLVICTGQVTKSVVLFRGGSGEAVDSSPMKHCGHPRILSSIAPSQISMGME